MTNGRDERHDRGRQTRRMSAGLIVAVILAVAIVDFVAQNTNDVTIHFLFWSREVAVWVALLITGVVAVIAVELFASYLRHRRD